MKTQEQQTLSIILHDLVASFIKIEHELNGKWERAEKIKYSSERIKEYSDILGLLSEVICLKWKMINLIREVMEG